MENRYGQIFNNLLIENGMNVFQYLCSRFIAIFQKHFAWHFFWSRFLEILTWYLCPVAGVFIPVVAKMNTNQKQNGGTKNFTAIN